MERKYKIDKGITVPPNGRERWNELYGTIAKMQKGDSVKVAFADKRAKGRLLAAIQGGARKAKAKMLTRTLEGNELRFWRVK